MRYVLKGVFKDEFLFCIDLLSKTRGEDIYQNIDAFFLRKMISNRNSSVEFVQMVLRLCEAIV